MRHATLCLLLSMLCSLVQGADRTVRPLAIKQGQLEEAVIMVSMTVKHVTCSLSNDGKTVLFESPAPSEGSGSGFIAEVGGAHYLYTNVHNLSGATSVKFASMKGTEIQGFESLEVSADPEIPDVARLKLRTPHVAALKFPAADYSPPHGAEVVAYGDSGGEKAVTLLAGKILGVGPGKIESDAGFIKGNSGGPLVLASTGDVVGINTYVEFEGDRQPVMIKGTRFTKGRRFSLRPDKVSNWKKMDFGGLAAERELINTLNRGTAALAFVWSSVLNPTRKGFDLDEDEEGVVLEKLTEIGITDPLAKRIAEGIAEVNGRLNPSKPTNARVNKAFRINYTNPFGGRETKPGAPVANHVVKQVYESFYSSVTRGAELTSKLANPSSLTPFHRAEWMEAMEVRKEVMTLLEKKIAQIRKSDWEE